MKEKTTRKAVSGLLAIMLASGTLAATIMPAMAMVPTANAAEAEAGDQFAALDQTEKDWIATNGPQYAGILGQQMGIDGFDFSKTSYTVSADQLKTISGLKDKLSNPVISGMLASFPFEFGTDPTGWTDDKAQDTYEFSVKGKTSGQTVTYTFTSKTDTDKPGTDKPDTQAKPLVIDLSKDKGDKGFHGIYVSKDGKTADGLDDDATTTITPGTWKLTYKQGADGATIQGTLYAGSKQSAGDKTKITGDGQSVDLKLRDPAATEDSVKDVPTEQTITVQDGAYGFVTSGARFGQLTLTPATDGGTTDPDKPATGDKGLHIGLNKDKTPISDIDGLTEGDYTLATKNAITDNKLAITIADKDGNTVYTAKVEGGELVAYDKDGKKVDKVTLKADYLLTVVHIGAGFEFVSATTDKPGATASYSELAGVKAIAGGKAVEGFEPTDPDHATYQVPAGVEVTLTDVPADWAMDKAVLASGTIAFTLTKGDLKAVYQFGSKTGGDTDKPAETVTYDLDLSKAKSSYGFYGDAAGRKVDGLTDDLTDTIKPGVYEISYDAAGDATQAQQVVVGSVYASSRTNSDGKTSGTGQSTDIKVRDKDDANPDDQQIPTVQKITVNQGGLGWIVSGSRHGTVHLKLVQALDTDGQQPGQNNNGNGQDNGQSNGNKLANTGVTVGLGAIALGMLGAGAGASILARRKED